MTNTGRIKDVYTKQVLAYRASESFFGHMKDEIHLEQCHNLSDLIFKIDDYMDYYNNDRYRWKLAKLAPNQYAAYLKTGKYPIEI